MYCGQETDESAMGGGGDISNTEILCDENVEWSALEGELCFEHIL